jgi:hypothetical protein
VRQEHRMMMRPLVLALALLAAPLAPALAAQIEIELADAVAVVDAPDVPGDGYLLRFELPEVLDGAEVEFAVVEFRADVEADGQAEGLTVEAFLAADEWDSERGDAGGSSRNAALVDRSYHAMWAAETGSSSLVRLDVTDMVRRWHAEPSANHGLVVTTSVGESGTITPELEAEGERGSTVTLTVWYSPVGER